MTCLYHADVWEQFLDHSGRSESPIPLETLPVLANLERHRQHSSGVQRAQVQHSIPCHHFVCSQLSGFRRRLEQILETYLVSSCLSQLCLLLLLGHRARLGDCILQFFLRYLRMCAVANSPQSPTPSGNLLADQKWMGLKKPILKDKLQYPRMFYVYLMASNLVLRLAWTYKLSPHLRQNLLTVLIFTLLEVFRRFQWIFVRIEVELRKLQASKPETGQLVPALPPKEIIDADELVPI